MIDGEGSNRLAECGDGRKGNEPVCVRCEIDAANCFRVALILWSDLEDDIVLLRCDGDGVGAAVPKGVVESIGDLLGIDVEGHSKVSADVDVYARRAYLKVSRNIGELGKRVELSL